MLASSEAASSRALAAVSVLDCSCGLVRPSILHQCGDAVQLSALDTARRAAHPVVRFQLAEGAKAAVQACHIADGPTVVIECEQQSLLVAFRASQPAEGTSSCRPAATEGPSTPGASTEEQGGWQVHKLQLPGQCRQRFLLRTGTDSNRAAPGRYRPLLCLSMGCKCGAEGGPHALLELQHIPGEGWTALEFIQAAAVRPAAVCQVLPPPEAASAALAAGFSPPAPRLAVATAAGDVLALSAGSAQHQLHTVLRALPEAEVVEERGADGTASGGGCGGLVGKILRSNLTERMQRQTESTGQPQTHSAACKLLAKTRLAHTAQRLICAPEGTGGQIIAVSGDKGGTLCCLEWPQLQPRCQLYGVSAVTADPVGLGICIHGKLSDKEVNAYCIYLGGTWCVVMQDCQAKLTSDLSVQGRKDGWGLWRSIIQLWPFWVKAMLPGRPTSSEECADPPSSCHSQVLQTNYTLHIQGAPLPFLEL